MKLAIFGATGTVGGALLEQSLKDGHTVQALARTPSKVQIQHPQLLVVPGDVADRAAVAQTIAGCEAVLTCLGGTNRRNPEVIQAGTAAIMAAMRAEKITRLIVMQGFHLPFPGDPRNPGRAVIRAILRVINKNLLTDSLAMAHAVQQSNLDWTVVRAPRVFNGPPTNACRTGQLKLGPWNRVSNGDVAQLMLRCLQDRDSIHDAPMISTSAPK